MKTFTAIIHNKPDCPMPWGVTEVIKANTIQVAQMYANIAAERWSGILVDLTEVQSKGQQNELS